MWGVELQLIERERERGGYIYTKKNKLPLNISFFVFCSFGGGARSDRRTFCCDSLSRSLYYVPSEMI